MKIVERVKNILTTPKTEWPAVAAEPATVWSLYGSYITIMALIPLIAGFINIGLVGSKGIGPPQPFLGLFLTIPFYVLSLLSIYAVALIINVLAPAFGGQRGMGQALKVAAYAGTAAFVGGIGRVVSWELGTMLILVGSIYGIYLLNLGLPATMKYPPEKAGVYTAVSVICAVACALVLYPALAVVWIGGLFWLGSGY